MAGNVGGLVATLSLDPAPFERGLGQATAQAKGFAGQMKRELSGVWGELKGNRGDFGIVSGLLQGGGSLGALAGLGAAGAAAAAGLELVRGRLADMASAARQADLLGATFQGYQVLEHLAPSAELLNTSLFRLQRVIGDAAMGSTSANEALAHLGLTLSQVQGLRTDQQFALIADRLNGIADPTIRAAVAQEIFGRGAVQLTSLIARGSAGIEAARVEFERLGLIVTPEQAETARKAQLAFRQMNHAVEGAMNSIALALAPAVVQLANDLRSLATTINQIVQLIPHLPGSTSSGGSTIAPGIVPATGGSGGGYFTSNWGIARIALGIATLGGTEVVGAAQNALQGGTWFGGSGGSGGATALAATQANTTATQALTQAMQAPRWFQTWTQMIQSLSQNLLELQTGSPFEAQLVQLMMQFRQGNFVANRPETMTLPGGLEVTNPLNTALNAAAAALNRIREREFSLYVQKLREMHAETTILQRNVALQREAAQVAASVRSPLATFMDSIARFQRLSEGGGLSGGAFNAATAQAFAQLQQQFTPQQGPAALLAESAAAASAIARFQRQGTQVDIQAQIRDLLRTAAESEAAVARNTAELVRAMERAGIVRTGRP